MKKLLVALGMAIAITIIVIGGVTYGKNERAKDRIVCLYYESELENLGWGPISLDSYEVCGNEVTLTYYIITNPEGKVLRNYKLRFYL